MVLFRLFLEKGLVHTTPSLSLSSFLHVPSFTANLLSISRITRDLNCSVTFFPSFYVFQDLQTRTIDSGREITVNCRPRLNIPLLSLALNKD